MAGKPPPPTSKAPVSRETVEVVRRKIAAPSGPPPAGMTVNFSAPKSVSAGDRNQYKRNSHRNQNDDDEDDDEDDNDDDYRERRRPSASRPRMDSRDKERGTERERDFSDYDDRNKKSAGDQRHRRSSEIEDGEDGGRRFYEDEEEVDHQEEEEEDQDDDYDRRGGGGQRGGPGRDEGPDSRRLKPTYDDHPSPVKASALNALPEAHFANSKESGHHNIPVATAAPVLSSKDVHSATYGPSSSSSMSKSISGPGAGPGGKLTIYNFQRLLQGTYRELKHFVMNPPPPGVVVRCYIERNRSGSLRLAPIYSLCADLEDGTGREILVCKKMINSRTSHYVFSLKSDDLYRKRDQRSRLYLGKLRATSNNDYVLYDNGICAAPEDPDSLLEALESSDNERDYHRDINRDGSGRDNAVAKKMERDMKEQHEKAGGGDDVSLYRKELAVIHFNSKTRPPPVGSRGMEICVPIDPNAGIAVAESKSTMASASSSSASSSVFNIVKPFERIRLAQKQNAMFKKTCLVFHEKTSRYDPLSSCLVDFRGRAQMASVKNFQLVISDPMNNYPPNPSAAQEMLLEHDANAEYLLQLGKSTDDCFNMDFRAPLSLLQCFAICIARFDSKLQW